MRRTIVTWIALASILFVNDLFALTTDQLREVKTAVVEMCRGGTITGDHQTFNVKGEADGKIMVLKKLVELGVNGEIQFTKNEWQGIEVLVPKDGDQSAYNHCVDNVFPIIIGELSSDNSKADRQKKIYSFEMPGSGPSRPGNPAYLVVPRHYDDYHSNLGVITLEIPPRGTTLSVNTVTSNSVSFLIDGANIEKIDSSLLENETKEWRRGKFLYSVTCTEIDNGPKGHLDWARFAVTVYEMN